MKPSGILVRLACCAALLALACSCAGHGAGSALFSPEDAKALQLGQKEWIEAGRASKSLNLNPGPTIRIVIPTVVESDSGPVVALPPVATIQVEFLQNTAPVDMKSLEIVARKGWFSRSLTEKLAPYIEGNNLKAKNLAIPTGQYKIEMRVLDTEARETKETFRFEVKD